VVDRVKIYLTSSFHHHAKFGCFSYCVRACKRSPNFVERWGSPLGSETWQLPRNTRPPPPTRVITPNFVALGQTVWAQVGGPKNVRDARAPPLGTGGGVTNTLKHATPPRITIPNLMTQVKPFGHVRRGPNFLGRWDPLGWGWLTP